VFWKERCGSRLGIVVQAIYEEMWAADKHSRVGGTRVAEYMYVSVMEVLENKADEIYSMNDHCRNMLCEKRTIRLFYRS
jgi:hypothetical protein